MIAQKNRNEESRQVHLILIDGRQGEKMIPSTKALRKNSHTTHTNWQTNDFGGPTLFKTKFEIHPPTHPPSPNYSVHQSDAAVSWL